MQEDLFVLDGLPDAFHKHDVIPAALLVHPDLDVFLLEPPVKVSLAN